MLVVMGTLQNVLPYVTISYEKIQFWRYPTVSHLNFSHSPTRMMDQLPHGGAFATL